MSDILCTQCKNQCSLEALKCGKGRKFFENQGITVPKNYKVWLITGAGKDLGRAIVEAALENGDRVAAFSRNSSMLEELSQKHGKALMVIEQDIQKREEVMEAVEKVYNRFGSIDVLLNNAGYPHFSAIEEASAEACMKIMENNYFGTMWVIQAVLPYMRRQKSGHVVVIGANTGINKWALTGLYQATKSALRGTLQTLAEETSALGIKVTFAEPGMIENGLATHISEDSIMIEDYQNIRDGYVQAKEPNPVDIIQPAGYAVLAKNLLKIVANEKPPFQALLNPADYLLKKKQLQKQMAEIEKWEELFSDEYVSEMI